MILCKKKMMKKKIKLKTGKICFVWPNVNTYFFYWPNAFGSTEIHNRILIHHSDTIFKMKDYVFSELLQIQKD